VLVKRVIGGFCADFLADGPAVRAGRVVLVGRKEADRCGESAHGRDRDRSGCVD